jgi:hypothetical protein
MFGTPQSTVEKNAIAAVACPRGAHVLPIAVGDCNLFDIYQNSQDCDDLPQLYQQPQDNSCWTTLQQGSGGGASFIRSMLPSQCCQGGNCGGGQASPLVGVGSIINMYNGQMNSGMHIMEDCIENEGLTDYVLPIVECQNGSLVCNSSARVIGFASARFTEVIDQGGNKGLNLEFFCNDEAPVQGGGAECFGTEGVVLVR